MTGPNKPEEQTTLSAVGVRREFITSAQRAAEKAERPAVDGADLPCSAEGTPRGLFSLDRVCASDRRATRCLARSFRVNLRHAGCNKRQRPSRTDEQAA
jgi:hypothetical protein